jgi:hypothetical protein
MKKQANVKTEEMDSEKKVSLATDTIEENTHLTLGCGEERVDTYRKILVRATFPVDVHAVSSDELDAFYEDGVVDFEVGDRTSTQDRDHSLFFKWPKRRELIVLIVNRSISRSVEIFFNEDTYSKRRLW